jgi:hypothetical protein
VEESPLKRILEAIDRFDADAAMKLMAPDVRFMTVDGRRAEGFGPTRELLDSFLSDVRSMSHQVTSQWHLDDAWIAEVNATYVLQDHLEIRDRPRAFVVRVGPEGVTDVRAYGARERPLMDHRTGEDGTWRRERWIPPL